MALPASGPISFNNINTELSNASGTAISLNDTPVRKMFNINAGAIDLNTGRGLGVVSSNLEINLDAKNASSYGGSGTTWYDISGNSRNFSMTNCTYTSGTNAYMSLNGTDSIMYGPASNACNLGQAFTIESVVTPSAAQVNVFFKWTGAGMTGDASRAILTHLPWVSGDVYFDVGGCCGSDQRINYASSIVANGVTHVVYRCRTGTTPYRQVFENAVSKVDSSTNSTATINYDSTPVVLGSTWPGKIHIFRVYSRALTDAEISQNFNAIRGRFGL
jgi:hypothetical protein